MTAGRPNLTVRRSDGKTVGGLRRITRLGVFLLLLAAGAAGVVLAQRYGRGPNGGEALYAPPNPRYDGRFTYARIKFTQTCCVYNGQYRDVKWGHDYPRSDFHFPKLLAELTTIRVRDDSTAIVTFDDPTLMRYPWAYMAEPGYWAPSDKEIEGLRNYLLKGGFLVMDDFVENAWYNFEEQMRRVFPTLRPIPLSADHPIFDSFYRIESLDFQHPNYPGLIGKFFGFFEDNDPTKRMMMVVNYDYDVSEYWEYSDEGFFPVDLTNTAYKLGINYMIYSMSR